MAGDGKNMTRANPVALHQSYIIIYLQNLSNKGKGVSYKLDTFFLYKIISKNIEIYIDKHILFDIIIYRKEVIKMTKTLWCKNETKSTLEIPTYHKVTAEKMDEIETGIKNIYKDQEGNKYLVIKNKLMNRMEFSKIYGW